MSRNIKVEELLSTESCKEDIFDPIKEIKREVCEVTQERNIPKEFSVPKEKGQKSCPHCSYTTPDASNLRRHMAVHQDERPYACDKCPKAFKRPATLRLHKLSHGQEKQFKCEKFIEVYKQHLQLHKKYACDKCDYKSGNKEHVRLHVACHLEAAIKCEHCDRMFKNDVCKKHHMQVHDKDHYICKVCSKDICGYHNLRAHMSTDHIENYINRIIKCDLCRYTTTSILAFKNHTTRHNDKACNKKFVCGQCEYISLSKWELVIHMNVHNDEHPEICHLCTFNTKSHRRLKNHVMNIHNGAKDIKCLHCDDMFHTKHDMELHKRRTHKSKPQCERCFNTFASYGNLKKHMKICELKSVEKHNLISFEKVEIKEEYNVDDEFGENSEVEEKIDLKVESVSFD